MLAARNPALGVCSVSSNRVPRSAGCVPNASHPVLYGRVRSSAEQPASQTLRASKRASTGVWRRRGTTPTVAWNPYPFKESEYYKAFVSLVITSAATNMQSAPADGGTVLLSRAPAEERPGERPRALVMFVGGDTLAGLSQLLAGISSPRPMALDLLWQVLLRGQQISEAGRGPSKWRLVRMAIVDMRNGVFHGRLFFGDAATGECVWDVDCRPSDGLWLALRSACPIFIKRSVWDACATEVEAEGGGSLDDALRQNRAVRIGSAATLRANPEEGLTGTALLTTVRSSDPESIKRIKREMAVAISEEDYKSAARLRDHPWMQLYMRAQAAHSDGDLKEALRLEAELTAAIEAFESVDVEPHSEQDVP